MTARPAKKTKASNALRKLSRKDLLRLLIEQMEENERLTAALDEANAKLASRSIALSEVGSIADASMVLSGIFDAAEEACEFYIKNAVRLKTGIDIDLSFESTTSKSIEKRGAHAR